MYIWAYIRIGEYIFGGVTRTLFRECPLPLVMAH